MKIEKYVSVAGATLVELDEAVNNHISQGFQPHGNAYVCDSRDTDLVGADSFLLVQPMVKFA
jgi:hypothetical protein